MTIRYVVSVAALVGLTACGGGGGGNLAGAASFVGLDQKFDQLEADNPFFLAPGLPASGTPQFSGIMLVGDNLVPGSAGPNAYLGSITVDVDFLNGKISGDAKDFFYVSVDSNFNPNGIDTTFSADGSVPSSLVKFVDNNVTGVVFSPEFSGSINNIPLGGTGTGGFLGLDADYVSISEDCSTCDFTFGVPSADVVIWAN